MKKRLFSVTSLLIIFTAITFWLSPPTDDPKSGGWLDSSAATYALILPDGTNGFKMLNTLKREGITQIPSEEFNDVVVQPHHEADGMMAYEVAHDMENAALYFGANTRNVIFYNYHFENGPPEEFKRWQKYVAKQVEAVKLASANYLN